MLVPLQAVDDAAHLVFTRRSPALPHHQGQIAFPGGTADPGDPDAVATALREAHEEIGVAPADVRVLAVLDDLETVGSGFVITPVVGVVPHPYDWRPCPREVDTIFTVPLATLEDPATARRETWDFGGTPWPVDSFAVGEHVIWGATYRITRNLLDLARTLA